jgi:hypothetical protein
MHIPIFIETWSSLVQLGPSLKSQEFIDGDEGGSMPFVFIAGTPWKVA